MKKQMSESLKKRMADVTAELQDIISELQKQELVHTQEALNFIDDINILSVSF